MLYSYAQAGLVEALGFAWHAPYHGPLTRLARSLAAAPEVIIDYQLYYEMLHYDNKSP